MRRSHVISITFLLVASLPVLGPFPLGEAKGDKVDGIRLSASDEGVISGTISFAGRPSAPMPIDMRQDESGSFGRVL